MASPLARVRGLGSAKEGADHWWVQRLTAVALVPLTLWFVYSIMVLAGAGLDEAQTWAADPFNALMLIILVVATFHHAQLGLQVVLEDYIHHELLKIGSLVVMKSTAFAIGLAGVLAVMRIALGSAG